MNPTDETVLARFSAGDMSTAEETEFLAHCESQPDLWRAAALALVEHRQLVSSLREFAVDRSDAPIHVASRSTGRSKMRRPTIFVVSASLLAVMLGGLSVAYWAGQHHRSGVQQANRDSPEEAADEPDPSVVVCLPPPDAGDYPDAARVQSPTVPSTEAAAARLAAMNSHPVFPGEARSLLRQAGVEVDEEPILYVLDDGSGERWAVPTRNFHLRYINHQH